MPMPDLTIRPARPENANVLTALCKRSKAYWGYDADSMAMSEVSLTITPELITNGLARVAQDSAGRIVGMASLDPIGQGTVDLMHMFVDPDAVGVGVGRALFEAITTLARQEGANKLSILSDPNAVNFYRHMGARHIGDAPSDAIPGRRLPLLEYDLRC